MVKTLGPIALILFVAAVGWWILGSTVAIRTDQSDSAQTDKLSGEWGGSQEQTAPTVTDAKTGAALPIATSRIRVGLDLSQRQTGLLWYNLYAVDFNGRYAVRNDGPKRTFGVHFSLPSGNGTYADVRYAVGGKHVDSTAAAGGNVVPVTLDSGESTEIDVAYSSRGMQSWTYRFRNGEASVNDFGLTMATNFKAIDFPANGLSPTSKTETQKGWRLEWRYASLITGKSIGMVIPYPMQPGPLAQRITMWAPLALLFYFFVIVLLITLRGLDLHPVNYFFLACAFFAFHLLFAYLVDRIPLEWAFAICSAVSVFLTVTYLRLVTGWRFAAVESGIAQLIYLVLFSLALFNEGWAGLTITCGAIVTLFAAMQLTGRMGWNAHFDRTQI